MISIKEYAANFSTIVDAFLKIGSKVILITSGPVVEPIVNTSPEMKATDITWKNADIQTCEDALNVIAREYNLPLVDLVSTYSTNPNPGLYVPDSLHPGSERHQILIEKVLDSILTY